MEKLKISENRRYFVTADGKPFSWLADTDWTMPQRLKWDDAEYLMQKRKSQGFTVLQIVALDPEADPEIRNPTGEKALIDDDILKPNERYFEYLDRILDMAEEYGFYVLLLPVWGQLVVGNNWMGETFPKTVTESNAFSYGEWIGRRYRKRNNILWCLGGDRQPIHLGTDYRNVWRRLAEGIAKGVLGKDLKHNQEDPLWDELLMTYHACHEAETGECSTMSYWTDEEAWIRFIMLQSGHGKTPKNYELVASEYGRAETMPVWDGEPAYEMMPTSWPKITDFHGPWMVRRRAYWSLFAGAFGYTYGHSSVWCSVSEKERSRMNPRTWEEALDADGAGQMKYLREFMDDLQPAEFCPAQERLAVRPDETLVSGAQEDELERMNRHIQVCENPEKGIVMAYLPSGGEISLDLSGFSEGKAFVWWYSPRDGEFYESAGRSAASASEHVLQSRLLNISAPSQGEECDWILIVTEEETGRPVHHRSYYELKEKQADKKVFEW